MNSQHTSTRRAPARALVAVVLLAGVFTMHGLAGNHDAATAITSHLPSMAVAHESGPLAASASPPGQAVAAAAAHSMGMTQTPTDEPMSVPAAVSPEPVVVEPSSEGHLHSMGDVCLAMLAALLLTLIVALARRSLTVAHPVVLAPAAVVVAADGPSPPWRRLTLSQLCVLRT